MPNNKNAQPAQRPQFPKRAVVTAGMPYGNKGLHFGHIGGVFVPADIWARFLRDRIGAGNVVFVSGTDCYGSPIAEGYRKARCAGDFAGSLDDYVLSNHQAQAQTLKAYGISLDIFEGSSIGKSKEAHERLSTELINQWYNNGWLHKEATAQFYDEDAQVFLNGRQVVGHCPVQGCKSSKAYADECDLGHQYLPSDLIAPVSTLSGKTPTMRDVVNWYFDLPQFRELLSSYIKGLKADPAVRQVLIQTIEEFLGDPTIYVKNEHEATYERIKDALGPHRFSSADKNKQSFELIFADLQRREAARALLDKEGVRLRTGKALVPLRITGNIDWGVPAPQLDNTHGLTVWVWPESLWAPISFTQTYLDNYLDQQPNSPLRWQDFWCSPDAEVYQFIGQDNIYFYGIAQTALFAALPQGVPQVPARDGELKQTNLIVNHHLLFLKKKASSSSDIKPPMADELLEYYSAEQLRAHFAALGLGLKPVSFAPKPLNPSANERDADPVLKDGQLLTNVLNRLARSCFYAAAKDADGMLQLCSVDQLDLNLVQLCRETILEHERLMALHEFHAVMQKAGDFIRWANKYWAQNIKDAGESIEARSAVLNNAWYLLRCAVLLMHPIAPNGCELVFEYLALPTSKQDFFSWSHIAADGTVSSYEPFVQELVNQTHSHRIKALPPRFDFF